MSFHSSSHEAFINSAYLSELWAVKDLLKFKQNHPEVWSPAREDQLQDEVVHARSLLNLLKDLQSPIVSDLSFSMQERLYKKYFDLNLCERPEDHCLIHQVTERRAFWIYKTYLRNHPNSPYAATFERILRDEANHFEVDDIANKSSPFFKEGIKGTDRILFRGLLPQKYGSKIFESTAFWSWYYEGARAELKNDENLNGIF